MNEENINYQGNQNTNVIPPQQPIPQDQSVIAAQQPVQQIPVATTQVVPQTVQSVPQQPQEFGDSTAQQPQQVQVPVQQQVASQPMQAAPPVVPPPPQISNNGTYVPSRPLNDIDNVGFIAVGQPIKKKKNKGLLGFIGFVVVVLVGLLVYFVAFPFVVKTFLNDPKNVYDVTITNLTKEINQTIETILYDKAIYSFSLDLDTNIEGLDMFSGYNYSGRMGIDPTNELFEYGYGVKDKYNKDFSYSGYIKNGRTYERYSTHDGLLYLGDLSEYKNQEFKQMYEDFRVFLEKYEKNNTSYLLNKLTVLFIESIDESKLVKEDASISINNKFIKTINNKYLLDKENLQRTKKFIIEGLINDEKALEIISNLEDIKQTELKVQLIEEADKDVSLEDEIVLSIYTYGAGSEIVGLELQQAKDFKIQHFFKDGNFNTFIYAKTIVNKETVEKTYNIDGIRVGDTTNITMMSDNKKYITLKIKDKENGKSIDYNIHEEFIAEEFNEQMKMAIAGNLTYSIDKNDKRNKITIDFSSKNNDDYLKASLIANIDWNSDVANINTADTSIANPYIVKQEFENQLVNKTPLGTLLLIINIG